MAERLAYSQKEAAAVLGLSVNTFKRYVRPHLRPVYVGGRRLYRAHELQAWLDKSATSL